MLRSLLRAAWAEPRVPAPPGVPWWDRAVVAVLAPAAVVEGLVRDDVPWPPYSIALALVCVLAVLGRTRHPLAVLVLAYSAQTAAGVGPALAGRDYGVLYVTSCVLLLPYSVGRWGSGRSVVVGVAFLDVVHLLREPLYGESAASILLGLGFLMLPAAVGVAVRFWSTSRERRGREIRLRERQQLARELHDTIAHHVSGILIQAQAARTVADSDPELVVDVLRTVEEEAARSLAEMRSLVGLLRDGAEAERAPAPGAGDLRRLVDQAPGPPEAALRVSGDLDGLDTTTHAVVYRVVQESLTNARRHARSATRVEVDVEVGAADVRVEVVDDGRPEPGGAARPGFGLVGMAERVELLDGTLRAGRDGRRGWRVSARVPRAGITA